VFAASAEVTLGALTDLVDFGVSAGEFEWSPVYLPIDEECDLLVGGLAPSWGLRTTGGAAKRGECGDSGTPFGAVSLAFN
jgi:hypothetical protein